MSDPLIDIGGSVLHYLFTIMVIATVFGSFPFENMVAFGLMTISYGIIIME